MPRHRRYTSHTEGQALREEDPVHSRHPRLPPEPPLPPPSTFPLSHLPLPPVGSDLVFSLFCQNSTGFSLGYIVSTLLAWARREKVNCISHGDIWSSGGRVLRTQRWIRTSQAMGSPWSKEKRERSQWQVLAVRGWAWAVHIGVSRAPAPRPRGRRRGPNK